MIPEAYQRRATKNVPRDLSGEWALWRKPDEWAGYELALVDELCASKHITVEALSQLEPRVRVVTRTGAPRLGYPRYMLHGGRLVVCGIRTRELRPGGRKIAVPGSAFAPPALPGLIGNLRARDWYVVEGETDAAKLWLLTSAAIMVLGGTVGAWHAAWDELIPDGSRVHVALDNDRRQPDEPRSVLRGHEAAAILVNRYRRRGLVVRRLLPPNGRKDWCST